MFIIGSASVWSHVWIVHFLVAEGRLLVVTGIDLVVAIEVGEQSERLTRDSEEMENLNRTLTGIAKIYELQLKGASQQVGTIDQINEQTHKMAGQIARLNEIYTRMIEAMTVNMRVAAPGVAPSAPASAPSPSQPSQQA